MNLPKNFIIKQSVPQQKLLEHVNLFITQAGMNSVNEAIYHGVPMLLLPHQIEQKMIAKRVREMGIGIVMNIKKHTPEELYEYVKKLISDSKYKNQALKYKSIMIKITYFVHGTTTDNEQDICTGWAHSELSKLGIKQAKELRILTKETHFDVVFCSDLKRAIQSAELAFSNKYKIIQDRRLREANYGDLNQHSIHTFNPDPCWYINNAFPNGESYKDVQERIADFIHYLKIKFADKHVAIVAHKAPQLALDVLLKNKTWEQAIHEDWRIEKKWQLGWDYEI